MEQDVVLGLGSLLFLDGFRLDEAIYSDQHCCTDKKSPLIGAGFLSDPYVVRLSLNGDNCIGSWSKQALAAGPVAVATRIIAVCDSVTIIVKTVGTGLALSFFADAGFATLTFGLVFSTAVLIDAIVADFRCSRISVGIISDAVNRTTSATFFGVAVTVSVGADHGAAGRILYIN